MASVETAELLTVPAGPGGYVDTGVDGSGIAARRITLCGCKAPPGQGGCVTEAGRGRHRDVGELLSPHS